MFGKRHNKTYAGVAQLVEQLICNQQVAGSSPITSSTNRDKLSGLSLKYGRVPEWPKGADCKSVVFDFNGSNPFSPTNNKSNRITMRLLLTYTRFLHDLFCFFGFLCHLRLLQLYSLPLNTRTFIILQRALMSE